MAVLSAGDVSVPNLSVKKTDTTTDIKQYSLLLCGSRHRHYMLHMIACLGCPAITGFGKQFFLLGVLSGKMHCRLPNHVRGR